MPNEKVLELLKKLNALAKDGVGGEKTTAQQMLISLMQKHGIKLEVIEDDIKTEREFKVLPFFRKLFNQVAASIINRRDIYGLNKDVGKYNRIFIDVTPSEYFEILTKFEFYKNKYEAEIDVLFTAFIHKNHLYPQPKQNDETDEELTPEEKAKLYKVAKMMEGMDRHHYYKQLK